MHIQPKRHRYAVMVRMENAGPRKIRGGKGRNGKHGTKFGRVEKAGPPSMERKWISVNVYCTCKHLIHETVDKHNVL